MDSSVLSRDDCLVRGPFGGRSCDLRGHAANGAKEKRVRHHSDGSGTSILLSSTNLFSDNHAEGRNDLRGHGGPFVIPEKTEVGHTKAENGRTSGEI